MKVSLLSYVSISAPIMEKQIIEIEYEYKKEHDGLSIFQDIMKQINVVYEKNCISKIQRAINSL